MPEPVASESEQNSEPDKQGRSSAPADSSDVNSASTQHSAATRKLKRLNKTADESNSSKSTVKGRSRKKKKASRLRVRKPEDFIGVSLASDRYVVKSQLGKGSMAYVFLAADKRLETDVVVKVPKPEKFTTADFRDRFKKESQLLVRFTHPHVVGVLDVGEYDELPYVVMQLLSGGSLADLLQKESNDKGQMPPDFLKTWLQGVGRALDFCARKGMIHRDVKPANILFDGERNPYVSDFGLSKVMYGDHTDLNSSETAAGAVLGTPNYIAPEIVLGNDYDGRADQYSLGISVYHTLLGRPPMQGSNATATMINQTNKQLQLLSDIRSDVPREAALAIRKSIDKKPENRFATCEEFTDAVLDGLRASAGQVPVASATVPANSKTATKKKKKKPAAAGSSSQSSVRKRAPRKKSRSARSGASKRPASSPDLEWQDLTSEGEAELFLPPKKGKTKASTSKKRKKKKGTPVGVKIGAGVIIFGLLLFGVLTFLKSDTGSEPVVVDQPNEIPDSASTSIVNTTPGTSEADSGSKSPVGDNNQEKPKIVGKVNLWKFAADDKVVTGGNAAKGLTMAFKRLKGNGKNANGTGFEISFTAEGVVGNWAQPHIKGGNFAKMPDVANAAAALTVEDLNRLIVELDYDLPEELSFGVSLESGPRIQTDRPKGSLLLRQSVTGTGEGYKRLSLNVAEANSDDKQDFVDSMNANAKLSNFYLRFNVRGRNTKVFPTSQMKVRRVFVKVTK